MTLFDIPAKGLQVCRVAVTITTMRPEKGGAGVQIPLRRCYLFDTEGYPHSREAQGNRNGIANAIKYV